MPDKQTPSNTKSTDTSADVKEPSNVRPSSSATPEKKPEAQGAREQIESDGE